MSVQMIIEMSDRGGTQTIVGVLEAYKTRLRMNIERTKRRLREFESRHNTTTEVFLTTMTAEDLSGGDLEYVEWAGEANLLKGLEKELGELEHARYYLP